MRFQDWDVLLFPGTSHVPIQEFRTACFLEHDGSVQTPTLVTYVPSSPRNTPFTISLHSWSEPQFSPGLGLLYGAKALKNAAWGVRVVVDGICVSSSTFLPDSTWPQIINASDKSDTSGKPRALPFPPFHRTVLSRRDWDLADNLGRIKVLISEGYQDTKGSKVLFQPLRHIACFSFHPAPLEYLERCNIAWPNPSIFAFPWRPGMTDVPKLDQPTLVSPHQTQYETPLRTYGGYDSGTYSSSVAMPPPPLPRSLLTTSSLFHPFPDMDSLPSRSTSGKSIKSSVVHPGSTTGGVMRNNTYAEDGARQPIRLASDQVRQIVDALRVNSQQGSTSNADMPPSLGVTQSKHESFLTTREVSCVPTYNHDRATGLAHHRTATDLSMHLDCTEFPACMSDDPLSGDLIHTTPTKFTEKHAISISPEATILVHSPGSDREGLPKTSVRDRKRSRSALGSLDPNTRGESPLRKVSKGGKAGLAIPALDLEVDTIE